MRRLLTLCAAVVTVLPTALSAQDARVAPAYRTPDQILVDIVDAAPTPEARLSPDNAWLLLLEVPSLPSIEELAERELRLAGLRIRPQSNGRSRTRYYNGLKLLRLADRSEYPITGLPAPPRLEHVEWSPDGRHVSFTHSTPDGIELWTVDATTRKAARLTGPVLNLTMSGGPVWLADSKTLIAAVVPQGRGPEPEAPRVPAGPIIQENLGKTAPARTYQDLLENPYDERLFEHYTTAQLALISLNGEATPIGEPGLIWRFDPSPDARYILVQMLHRPFSYLVPAYRFPRTVDVLDRRGRQVYRLADLPLQEEVPIAFGSVPTGPRDVEWRADAGATLAWVEAQDGGDPARPADRRDKVLMLAAPFQGDPQALATLGLRYEEIRWGSDDVALVSESWWQTRRVRTWVVRPGSPGSEPVLLFDRSREDRYNDPGNPAMRHNAAGREVMNLGTDGMTLYLMGTGGSPEGNRPFLDTRNVGSPETHRLFRSEAPYYERPIQVLDETGRRVLTIREAVDQPPNFFVRDIRSGELRRVTAFANPTPQLAGMQKELIEYQRADGVKLNGTLYLPPGYVPAQGPLPTLLWAYPREFKSADAAGQITDSPYRFDRLSGWSSVIWLTQGYAVLDGPTMPIVGEGDAEPNDTYVRQLVASAEAAVDEVVRRGVADRHRIAIGGHSYGAFMAANLLVHSDLFAAGIARSGAYNRTLTPFGFQAEERTLWQAPDVYFRMSPFMHVDEIDEPILLIHGAADNNSGTYPMQSERFYSALKGLGKTARLVMLPAEAHGYRARESILHMLWEMQEWLDQYVKRATPREERVTSDRS